MPLTEMQCKCILKTCMDWGPAAGAAQPVVGGDASSEAQNHRTGPDWPPPFGTGSPSYLSVFLPQTMVMTLPSFTIVV
jgi:hypothetical protein